MINSLLNNSFNYFLPAIILSSATLIVMLLTSYKRHLAITAPIIIASLLLSLFFQFSLSTAPLYENALFTFDRFSAMAASILLLSSSLVSLFLPYWLSSAKEVKEEFYLLLLLATIGSLIVVSANHFASFFLGLELMGISLIPMIAYLSKCRRSLEAGVKYLILSSIASAFILMAIALLYLYSGSLAMNTVSQAVITGFHSADDVDTFSLITAGILLLVGLSFKLSLVPNHLWAADVFEGAPLPTNALLASLSKVSVFIVFLRLFNQQGFLDNLTLVNIIIFMACASMLVGNLLGLLQNNIIRLLAYSSIAHFGYLLITVLALNNLHTPSMITEGAIVYLLAYSVASVGIFTMLMLLPNITTIDNLTGLLWKQPAIASTLILLFLSLAGIPLTLGFMGKFYLAIIAINHQYWLLLSSLFIGSLLGVFYYLRVILAIITPSLTNEKTLSAHSYTLSNKLLHSIGIAAILIIMIGAGILPNTLATFIISHL